jgi:hypothetical protein
VEARDRAHANAYLIKKLAEDLADLDDAVLATVHHEMREAADLLEGRLARLGRGPLG